MGISKTTKDRLLCLLLVIFLILGFYYRFYGLNNNYSFWSDEEYIAIFTRAILERGRPVLLNGYSDGIYKYLQYWLSAVSAKIFGLNEFSVRFPSVIFGVLTIWAVFLLGEELFGKKLAIIAAFFASFLAIEILWSRQARPYQALQFFYVLGVYFAYRLVKDPKFDWRVFLGFILSGLLASLMHGLGLILVFLGLFYISVFRSTLIKKKWFVLLLTLITGFLLIYLLRDKIALTLRAITVTLATIGGINNLYYYRVFLWHNYFPLVVFSFFGLVNLILSSRKRDYVLVLVLIVQFLLVSFVLPQPFTRYFYIVFPFFILLSVYGLLGLSNFLGAFFKKRPKAGNIININDFFLIAMTIFVIFFLHRSGKIILFPKSIYSLNSDMQEIPEVDYKKIYSFVRSKLDENPNAVFISNWFDHPVWYLGEGKLDYLLAIARPPKEKDEFSGAVYIPDLNSLMDIVNTKKKGIILLESWESLLPEGTREYIRNKLKKELEVDRLYPVQPRYWPVEVYSWGI